MELFIKFAMGSVAVMITIGLIIFAGSVLKETTKQKYDYEQKISGDRSIITNHLVKLCEDCISSIDKDCFFVEVDNEGEKFSLGSLAMLNNNDFINSGMNNIRISSKNGLCMVDVIE